MVTRKRLNVTLHVHCLFLYFYVQKNIKFLDSSSAVECAGFVRGKSCVSNLASDTGYSEGVMISVSTYSKCGDINL